MSEYGDGKIKLTARVKCEDGDYITIPVRWINLEEGTICGPSGLQYGEFEFRFDGFCKNKCPYRGIDDKRNLEPCINCPVGTYLAVLEG